MKFPKSPRSRDCVAPTKETIADNSYPLSRAAPNLREQGQGGREPGPRRLRRLLPRRGHHRRRQLDGRLRGPRPDVLAASKPPGNALAPPPVTGRACSEARPVTPSSSPGIGYVRASDRIRRHRHYSRDLAGLRGSPAQRRRREQIVKVVFLAAALVSILISVLIVWSLVGGAVAFIQESSSTSCCRDGWYPRRGEFGLLTLIVGTLLVTAIALVVAVPVGLAAGDLPRRVRDARAPARSSSRSWRSSPASRASSSASSP